MLRVGEIPRAIMWRHSLTRDPRVKQYEEHIKEYFERKLRILRERRSLIEKLGLAERIVTTTSPTIEPIPKGSTDDIKLWSILVQAFHSLPFMGGVGRYIRFYIKSSSNHQILGCLSLGSAVLKCAARDKWIGWSMQERLRNLNRVANNRRFLIMPHVKVPNLASRVLSLLCEVGRKEWERRYGDPLVLIETFVESERSGTCYKAANWILLGETKGFAHVVSGIKPTAGKNVSVYLYTGSRRLVFAKPLLKSWRDKLKE